MNFEWMYHRRTYDHEENPQTQYFKDKMKEVGTNWQQLSDLEKEQWKKQAEILWQTEGRKLKNSRLTGFNLFVRDSLVMKE
jgi:hypothetical protein